MMHNIRVVTIESFDHRMQADMLLLLLHQHDIPARLADEHIVAMEWALANAIGGIKVQVPITHESEAREIALQLKASAKSIQDRIDPESNDDSCLSCSVSMPDDQCVCGNCGWSYNE